MAAYWPNFMEKIAEVLSHILTDDEAEAILRRLPTKSSFATHLRVFSSNNLARLASQSPKRPHCCHKGSCRYNAIRGFVKTFLGAFAVKYAVAVLPAILTGRAFRQCAPLSLIGMRRC